MSPSASKEFDPNFFQAGREYEIVYQIAGIHRVPRRARMSFIGKDTLGEYEFNGRNRDPSKSSGTQHFRLEWIISARDVGPSAGREDPYNRRYTNKR